MTGDVPSGLTILEAIGCLRSPGYGDDFSIIADGVRCGRCVRIHGLERLQVTALLRVEGASDPADEAIVAGVRCGTCGSMGVLVAGYGPTGDAAEAAVLGRLGDVGRDGGKVGWPDHPVVEPTSGERRGAP